MKTKENRKIFYVYGLFDPESHQPFYIGKGHGKRIKEQGYGNSPETAKNISLGRCLKTCLIDKSTNLPIRFFDSVREARAVFSKEYKYSRRYRWDYVEGNIHQRKINRNATSSR